MIWTLPILTAPDKTSFSVVAEEGARLEKVLASYDIKGSIVRTILGPVVTHYDFAPEDGFKIAQIEKIAADIGRSMATDTVRISNGKGYIGIEVPRKDRAAIPFQVSDTDKVLPLFLGNGIDGASVVEDLASMPHLLVAGTTGSGKSVCLNGIVSSLLASLNPDQLKFILIDPKMLELAAYRDIPHLVFPVITEAPKVINALEWAIAEMERRYHLMSEAKVRNLAQYNLKHALLPHIVIVVDEYADLLAVCGKGLEKVIQRLAQKARAAGIHVVLATQRPSVDVVTGVIKANFPARLCLRVISQADSRTILNRGGAEHLLGKGDMILQSDRTDGMRIHGAYIADAQIDSIAEQWRGQGKPKYQTVVRDDKADIVQEDKAEVVQEDTPPAKKPFRYMVVACLILYCIGTMLVLQGNGWGVPLILTGAVYDPTFKKSDNRIAPEKRKG